MSVLVSALLEDVPKSQVCLYIPFCYPALGSNPWPGRQNACRVPVAPRAAILACSGAIYFQHNDSNKHREASPMRRALQTAKKRKKMKKADSTLRTSQAVPHPSTIRALSCLTSEVRRDPVHSTRYGRQRKNFDFVKCSNIFFAGISTPATRILRVFLFVFRCVF